MYFVSVRAKPVIGNNLISVDLLKTPQLVFIDPQWDPFPTTTFRTTALNNHNYCICKTLVFLEFFQILV